MRPWPKSFIFQRSPSLSVSQLKSFQGFRLTMYIASTCTWKNLKLQAMPWGSDFTWHVVYWIEISAQFRKISWGPHPSAWVPFLQVPQLFPVKENSIGQVLFYPLCFTRGFYLSCSATEERSVYILSLSEVELSSSRTAICGRKTYPNRFRKEAYGNSLLSRFFRSGRTGEIQNIPYVEFPNPQRQVRHCLLGTIALLCQGRRVHLIRCSWELGRRMNPRKYRT